MVNRRSSHVYGYRLDWLSDHKLLIVLYFSNLSFCYKEYTLTSYLMGLFFGLHIIHESILCNIVNCVLENSLFFMKFGSPKHDVLDLLKTQYLHARWSQSSQGQISPYYIYLILESNLSPSSETFGFVKIT